MKKYLIQIFWATVVCCARGQSTMQYDQESITTEIVPPGGIIDIQSNDPIGQSFIPSLSSVGFVRLYLDDQTVNGVGATAIVSLWSGALGTGTLLDSTAPVSIPDGFFNYTTFSFSNPVTVTPGATYFFQLSIQSGDPTRTGVEIAGYPNGTAFFGGTASPGEDLTFREGIVVPEPSTLILILIGWAGIHFYRRKNRWTVPLIPTICGIASTDVTDSQIRMGLLNPMKQILKRSVNGFGYSLQSINGNVFPSSLYIADI